MKTKEILKEWKSFVIKEYNAARVKSMIDDLEDYRYKIVITDKGEMVSIAYDKPNNNNTTHTLHGSINCMSSKKMFRHKAKPDGSSQGIGKGESNPVWYVTLTRDTTRGMGPLLYEVLIEYISSRKDAALKPDASSISTSAKNVWEIFDQRSDITQIQLDVDDETVDINKRYNGNEIIQLTHEKSDDTKQNTAINDKGYDDWSQSALSRAYRKDKTLLIDALLAKNLITMPDPPKVFKSKLGSAWG